MVVAIVALVVAASGTATAATLITSGLIKNGTVRGTDIRNGTIRGTDIGNHAIGTTKLSTKTVRSLRGKTGPPCAATDPACRGPKGADGSPATRLWAVVGADGTLVRGSPGAVATKLFAGVTDGSYQVALGRNLSGCALLANIGRTDSADMDPDPGEIGTAYRNGVPNAVYVKTRDSAGASADRSFHVAVFC
jgi:hypothetical protein